MAPRKFDEALHAEIARIRMLGSHESRGRAIRRALLLVTHAERELTRERDGLIHTLATEYGWSHAKIAKYFGLSRQRITQLVGGAGNLSGRV